MSMLSEPLEVFYSVEYLTASGRLARLVALREAKWQELMQAIALDRDTPMLLRRLIDEWWHAGDVVHMQERRMSRNTPTMDKK